MLSKKEQVVAPMGLDITVVMPNHNGFVQHFFQGTESAAKALWDRNRQDSIIPKKAENKQIACLCNEY